MAVEFERSMSTIVGRSVTITSWWDAALGTWRASAPAYNHLRSVHQSGPVCATRADAIRRLTQGLADQLPPAPKSRY